MSQFGRMGGHDLRLPMKPDTDTLLRGGSPMTNPPVFANAPRPDCPKCGHQYGFRTGVPRYDADPEVGERLLWTCRYCGHVIDTPVATPTPLEPPR